MSRSRVLFHMVRADFLERVRRYSFLLTLGFAVYLGYAVYSGQIHMHLNDYQGAPNSAWLGSVVALVSSIFLSLIGFYVVKNTIWRDRETRVGRILAATPISKRFYTLSKALSNLAVLSAMVLVLAAAAVVIQLTHRAGNSFNLFDLLAPILMFGISAMSVAAALAVLFETIPGLRGGLGNIAYFFLWIFLLSLSVNSLLTREQPGLWLPCKISQASPSSRGRCNQSFVKSTPNTKEGRDSASAPPIPPRRPSSGPARSGALPSFSAASSGSGSPSYSP
jgi:hypothetical protein